MMVARIQNSHAKFFVDYNHGGAPLSRKKNPLALCQESRVLSDVTI